MSRRYDRSRRYGGTRWRWLVGVAVVALVATMVVPAASYTSSDIDRSVNADVANDSDAVIGIVENRPEVGERDTLVKVTNRFSEPVDVTIRLVGWGAIYADIDDDGTPDELTLTVAENGERTFEICAQSILALIFPLEYEFEFEGDSDGISGSSTSSRSVDPVNNNDPRFGCTI